MYAEGDVKVDLKIFNVINYNPTTDETSKLKANYQPSIVNNVLTFDVPPDKPSVKQKNVLLTLATDKRKTADERLDALVEIIKGLY